MTNRSQFIAAIRDKVISPNVFLRRLGLDEETLNKEPDLDELLALIAKLSPDRRAALLKRFAEDAEGDFEGNIPMSEAHWEHRADDKKLGRDMPAPHYPQPRTPAMDSRTVADLAKRYPWAAKIGHAPGWEDTPER